MLVFKDNIIQEIDAFKSLLQKTVSIKELLSFYEVILRLRFRFSFKQSDNSFSDYVNFIKEFATNLGRKPSVSIFDNNLVKITYTNDSLCPLSDYITDEIRQMLSSVFYEQVFYSMFSTDLFLRKSYESSLWQGASKDVVILQTVARNLSIVAKN
jgi:hypothetical protein